MKKIYSAFTYIRLWIILLGIPLILVEWLSPGLFDFSALFGHIRIFGTELTVYLQLIVVGSELGEHILKLKEARFHLFNARLMPIIRRMR